MPKVSILLPVYNAERYLAVALASLLVQTHRAIEVIAIDDGSKDGSRRILDAAAAKDPRVSVVSRDNRGLIATLNEGLALADSDFVARMDADDIAYPDRIAAQLACFEGDSALGLLGTNFDTILTSGRVEPAPKPSLTRSGERAVFGRFVTPLRHPTVMFRRTRLASAQLVYDPAYPCAEDFDLFRRLAEHSRIAETPAAHLAYRLHGGSVSARHMGRMVSSHLAILAENMRRYYPKASVAGLEALGDQVSAGAVEAAADLISSLDAMAHTQPDAERHAFVAGVTTSFYFLYAHICRSGRYDLARRFVDRAQRWHSVRRRERLLLAAEKTVAVGPAFALFEQGIQLRRTMRSSSLGRTVPDIRGIGELAQRIEQDAKSGSCIRIAA